MDLVERNGLLAQQTADSAAVHVSSMKSTAGQIYVQNCSILEFVFLVVVVVVIVRTYETKFR